MADSHRSEPSPASQALGRLPSGLWILTVDDAEDGPTGLLVSWVQQAGFDPPMLTVALRSDSHARKAVERAGAFVLNQVPAGNKGLLKHFARGFPPGADAFAGVDVAEVGDGAAPVLGEALAYLELRVVGGMDSGDHRIVLAEVVAGALIGEGEPMVHVRRNGTHY